MDKKNLNPAELQHLKQFIIARSERYAEPVVLLEIMDHFACKTEEILEEEPGILFDEAMKKAYRAFGANGFATIADTFERNVHKGYGTWYLKEWNKVLFSSEGALLFVIALLSYWNDKFQHMLYDKNMPLLFLGASAVSVVSLWIMRFKTLGKVKQHMLYYRQATAVGKHVFLLIGVSLLPLLLKDVLAARVLTVLVLAGMFVAAISTIVYKRLMQKAGNDAEAAEQLLHCL